MISKRNARLKKLSFIIFLSLGLAHSGISAADYKAEEDFTAIWSRQEAQNFNPDKSNTVPHVDPNFKLTAPDLWIWVAWPLQNRDGSVAAIDGYKVMFALTAPRNERWEDRHDIARIGYFYSKNGMDWTYGGPAYNVEEALGSRQWAGSAMLDENGRVHLFYTATGNKGETVRTAEQRLAKTTFEINADNKGVHLSNWGNHQILLEPDGVYYETLQQSKGPIIYAFRDPAFFKDPKTGKEYLLFEGTKGGATNPLSSENIGDEQFRKTHLVPAGAELYKGNIGIAMAENKELSKFKLLPPLIEANGVNQELELPRMIVKGNHYYLFTVTHRHTYAPGLDGPDGLYGFVGEQLRDDYKPLNGNGLVVVNPPDNPFQTYAWIVLPNTNVISLIHEYKIRGQTRYGGTFAPTLMLELDGGRTKISGVLPEGAVTGFHQ